MKKFLSVSAMVLAGTIFSCQTDDGVNSSQELSPETLSKIRALGFSTHNAFAAEGGYVVEGDILLHDHDLNGGHAGTYLVIANEEQYRTTNLVKSLPRTITVSISSKLPTSYVAALDEALARYNAQNLTLTFTRVASGADISLVNGNGSYLASAGFPTSSGDPYGQVKVNARAIGNQPQSTVATIIAHEIGHCIGFRHTDYMNRSYSCGGSPTNEGASTVGAIHIPGTPTGPDANSWMLSCIGSGQNRPFNSNDRTALGYLY
ncbi:MAG TPA: M57 family metalloprotease [Chryseosolibacter sp.]